MERESMESSTRSNREMNEKKSELKSYERINSSTSLRTFQGKRNDPEKTSISEVILTTSGNDGENMLKNNSSLNEPKEIISVEITTKENLNGENNKTKNGKTLEKGSLGNNLQKSDDPKMEKVIKNVFVNGEIKKFLLKINENEIKMKEVFGDKNIITENQWSEMIDDIKNLTTAVNCNIKWATRLKNEEFFKLKNKIKSNFQQGYYWNEDDMMSNKKEEIATFITNMLNQLCSNKIDETT